RPPRSSHLPFTTLFRSPNSGFRHGAAVPYTVECVQRDLSTFEERIGYKFQRRDLLTRALTHKSYSHEARHEGVQDNETFEFLGEDRKSTRLNSSHQISS